MTDRQYKEAREIAENNGALYQYEKWNGSIYPSRYLNSDDMRELRGDNRKIAGAYTLDGFNGRAVLIPGTAGAVYLKSYNTTVAVFYDGLDGCEMYKTWNGFSVTTLKHINIARSSFGLPAMSKREWIEYRTEYGDIVSNSTGEFIAEAV